MTRAGNAVTYRRPGLLRIPAVRWLIAELIPFGGLAGCLALSNEVRPVTAVGFIFALFGVGPLTMLWLYKVLGAAMVWIWAIMPLMIVGTFLGEYLFGHVETCTYSKCHSTVVTLTPTWWIVLAVLAALLALAVAGAIVNGERWVARNAGNLPRNKFERFARSRGTAARLWLPR